MALNLKKMEKLHRNNLQDAVRRVKGLKNYLSDAIKKAELIKSGKKNSKN